MIRKIKRALVAIGATALLVSRIQGFTLQQPTFVLLDVGQGDALMIQNSEGFIMLIDTGPSDNILFALDEVWHINQSLDFLLITHPDADHAEGALGLLGKADINEIWASDVNTFEQKPLWKEIKKSAGKNQVSVHPKSQGESLKWGCCIKIEILWPPKGFYNTNANESSLSTLVSYGNFDLLNMGDLSTEQELKVLDYLEQTNPDLKLEALKVSHHGSRTSSSKAVISSLNPLVALIGVGKDNSYGHPHTEVLSALAESETEVWRTDLHGNISVYVNSDTTFYVRTSSNFLSISIELERFKVYNLPTYSLDKMYV